MRPCAEPPAFSTGLVRQLVFFHSINAVAVAPTRKANLRMTNEAALTAAELLRLFVVETRNRASILAECEEEMLGASPIPRTAQMDDTQTNLTNEREHNRVAIKSNHVTQVAAEIIMDFT